MDLSNLTADREIEMFYGLGIMMIAHSLEGNKHEALPAMVLCTAELLASGKLSGWSLFPDSLQRPRLTPVGSTESLQVVQPLSIPTEGHQVRFQILADGKEIASKTLKTNADFTLKQISLYPQCDVGL